MIRKNLLVLIENGLFLEKIIATSRIQKAQAAINNIAFVLYFTALKLCFDNDPGAAVA
jgi:hypothetical protein